MNVENYCKLYSSLSVLSDIDDNALLSKVFNNSFDIERVKEEFLNVFQKDLRKNSDNIDIFSLFKLVAIFPESLDSKIIDLIFDIFKKKYSLEDVGFAMKVNLLCSGLGFVERYYMDIEDASSYLDKHKEYLVFESVFLLRYISENKIDSQSFLNYCNFFELINIEEVFVNSIKDVLEISIFLLKIKGISDTSLDLMSKASDFLQNLFKNKGFYNIQLDKECRKIVSDLISYLDAIDSPVKEVAIIHYAKKFLANT